MHSIILILHVIAASIWTGGHLILSIVILPGILKTKDIDSLIAFEQKYERIGMPALIIQITSGLYLAYSLLPNFSEWFSFSSHISSNISIKLTLLLITLILAANANFRLIPNLSKGNNLKIFAAHIITVTLISVLFIIMGMNIKLALF